MRVAEYARQHDVQPAGLPQASTETPVENAVGTFGRAALSLAAENISMMGKVQERLATAQGKRDVVNSLSTANDLLTPYISQINAEPSADSFAKIKTKHDEVKADALKTLSDKPQWVQDAFSAKFEADREANIRTASHIQVAHNQILDKVTFDNAVNSVNKNLNAFAGDSIERVKTELNNLSTVYSEFHPSGKVGDQLVLSKFKEDALTDMISNLSVTDPKLAGYYLETYKKDLPNQFDNLTTKLTAQARTDRVLARQAEQDAFDKNSSVIVDAMLKKSAENGVFTLNDLNGMLKGMGHDPANGKLAISASEEMTLKNNVQARLDHLEVTGRRQPEMDPQKWAKYGKLLSGIDSGSLGYQDIAMKTGDMPDHIIGSLMNEVKSKQNNKKEETLAKSQVNAYVKTFEKSMSPDDFATLRYDINQMTTAYKPVDWYAQAQEIVKREAVANPNKFGLNAYLQGRMGRMFNQQIGAEKGGPAKPVEKVLNGQTYIQQNGQWFKK